MSSYSSNSSHTVQDSGVGVGRFFWWGDDGRFSHSVDVFLREDALDELAEFPSRGEVQRPEDGSLAVGISSKEMSLCSN